MSCVFTFHKTWNKAVSHRSLAVTEKKCTKKCDAHGKLLLNLLFRGCSEGFQMMVSKKNIHEHWTGVTHFNPLWVPGLLTLPVLSPQHSLWYVAKMSTYNFSNFLVLVIFLQWVHVLTTSLLKLSAEHKREEKEYHFNSDTTQLFYE